jgi:hypothetical protein
MQVTGNIELFDKGRGWRQPSTYHIRGTLSGTNSTIFSSGSGYTTVVYDYTFAAGEDFIIIAYWAHNYRGTGFVYGPTVNHTDFNGYSADGYGPYAGALNTSGFPNGYSATFFGQYHAPIGSGGAATTGYWFKWQRSGNTLTLQYATDGPGGPWTNFTNSSSTTIASTDAVCIVVGEAGDTEVQPLRIESQAATLKHNDRPVFAFLTNTYRFDLNLIRGYVGGGYIGSTLYSNILRLLYATDSWSYMASSLNKAIKYAGWASAMSNGYTYHNVQNGDTTNDRVNFATDTVQAIAVRPNGAGGSPSSCQHGIGYLPSALPSAQGGTYNTLASYGTKGFEVGKGTTYMDILLFASETWTSTTGAPVGQYAVGWFDKDYSFQFASAYGGSTTVTNKMPHSTEVWTTVSTNSNPGALGMPGSGAEKGVNSKQDKFYLAGNWGGSYCSGTDGNRIFKFVNTTSTWTVNSGSQTRWNNEHAGLMGMNWGYFAGGYNCTDGQNAHSDKINYNIDTIVQITDAPRSASSGSGMWASF